MGGRNWAPDFLPPKENPCGAKRAPPVDLIRTAVDVWFKRKPLFGSLFAGMKGEENAMTLLNTSGWDMRMVVGRGLDDPTRFNQSPLAEREDWRAMTLHTVPRIVTGLKAANRIGLDEICRVLRLDYGRKEETRQSIVKRILSMVRVLL